jgi:DNA-binding NarL/FixJ family response regulator
VVAAAWGGFRVDETSTEDAIVIDELALVRAGIVSVLRTRGIEITAATRSAREAVSLATIEHPDLVVCGAPADLTVVDAMRRLVKLRPRPALVALLPPAHEHVVAYLLALGAHGVALRSADADELGTVVDTALKGGQYVAPALQAALTGNVRLRPVDEHEEEVLTSREREVLVLLAEGRTNREIAAALSVTLATVKSHLVRIYSKLEASNRNEALGRAVALGLLR